MAAFHKNDAVTNAQIAGLATFGNPLPIQRAHATPCFGASDMAPAVMVAADRGKPQDQARLGYRYILQLAIVFVLYFEAGKLGLAVPFTRYNVSPI